MTVLVLDGHSRAAVESLQSLGRAGYEVDVASETPDCLAFHSRYAARKLRQPAQDSTDSFLAWLRQQEQKRGYELIVPATEASLLGLRQLEEQEPLRRKAVLPANESIDIALDKEKTWALARQLGVPVPASRLLTSLAEIGQVDRYPVVLKPVRSKLIIDGQLRTLSVAVVRNELQRQEQLRTWLPVTQVMQQQYVSGQGVGAEFLFNRGHKVWHFVHQRIHEYPLSGGASSYRRAIPPPAALLADAEKLLTALHWHGVAMVEFKMDAAGQYWLMEINPRLWGSLAVSIDAGVDFPLGLLQVARGEHTLPQPDYKMRYTRDIRTDLEWLKANLRADPQDPLLHTRSRSFSLLELLRPLTGQESWDHFDWRDLGVTASALRLAVTDQLRPVFRKVKNWNTQRRLLAHHRALLRRLPAAGPLHKIVFLCYGNICRSPLAAALAEKQLSATQIQSAGFHDATGRRSPEKILRIATSFGIDLSNHRSTRCSIEHLRDAGLVIAMDRENLARLKREFPECISRTTLLGLFADPPIPEIADPYLADEPATEAICHQVRSSVRGLANWLSSLQRVDCLDKDPASPPQPALKPGTKGN